MPDDEQTNDHADDTGSDDAQQDAEETTPAGEQPDTDDDKDDDLRDELAQVRAELSTFKRRNAEAEKRAKKAERALNVHKRSEDEQAGEYKKLYEEKVREFEALEKRVQADKMDRSVVACARRLNFRNPDLAPRLVALDSDVEPDDDPLIERALKKLAKAEPYLLRADRGQSSDVGTGDGATPAPKPKSPENTTMSPMERLRDAYTGPPKKRETVKTW